jgi:hypothetical protein
LKIFNISICYTRYVEITDETIDLLLGALADQLQALGSHVEIVVIGGSALAALGLVRRDQGRRSPRDSREWRIAPRRTAAANPPGRARDCRSGLRTGRGLVEPGANGPGLNPTQGELIAAARWSITQDPSTGYRSVLVDALRVLGIDDADLGD